MSTSQSSASDSGLRPLAEIVSVVVELRRLHEPRGKIKAYADVTLFLRPTSSIVIHGFAVMHEDEKAPVVLSPSQKGEQRFFRLASLTGQFRQVVDTAILGEYSR